jgi:DSF synthase
MDQITETAESLEHSLTHAVTRFDTKQGIAWCYMNPEPRPCITLELLADVRKCQRIWEHVNRSAIEEGKKPPIRYAVLASLFPGVYSYGGDLKLFIGYIHNGDREGLRTYARMCIEDVYLMSVNLKQPMTTISLVQGDALGGGFEAALSCNVIVAEKGAQFGLPEILFNLFPGMGAYSILSRKLGVTQAEKIILSGALYSATEMHEMGVVDLLAEDGEGERAVYEYVAQHARKRIAFQSILQARHRVHPVSREELMDVAEIWVDAAMNIGSRELRVMERLARAQEKVQDPPGGTVVSQKIRG